MTNTKACYSIQPVDSNRPAYTIILSTLCDHFLSGVHVGFLARYAWA